MISGSTMRSGILGDASYSTIRIDSTRIFTNCNEEGKEQ